MRHSRTEKSTLLAAQTLQLWAGEVRDALREAAGADDPKHTSIVLGVLRDSNAQDVATSVQAAQHYRDQGRSTPVAAAVDARWPLYRPLSAPDPQTPALRQRFGFAADQRINVVVIFVETWRALEFIHPELGPQVFPRLRALFDRHAIWFSEAYSAAIEAAMTVRGQFGALCSMLPGNGGPAAYIAYPNLALTCLAQLFQQAGYQTAWFYAQSRRFHNTGAFEERHGTGLFFDDVYFRSRGITQRIGDWGLADRPVLQETLQQLLLLGQQGPFFADIVTSSTHHPCRVIDEGPLPEALAAATADNGDYAGYLSHLVYLDRALADFLEQLFASPIGERTLVVVLGDHGSAIRSHVGLSELGQRTAIHRIPIAFLAKQVPQPAILPGPINQIDVAPTVAAIVGLRGDVSWLGRDALVEPGSPFIAQSHDDLVYRDPDRLCGRRLGEHGAHCWQLAPGVDPMLAPELPDLAEDVEQTRRYQRLMVAIRQLVDLDLLAPHVP